jgi:hypothetical protein
VATDGYFSTTFLYPMTTQWQTADRHTFTAVDAGAWGQDKSVGALGIVRNDYIRVTQREELHKVPGAGVLKIVSAPEGKSVETWAQKRGKISFVGSAGVRGTLDLSTGKVTTR